MGKIKVLYLINFAGKAGTEKYVENLIDFLPTDEFEPHLCFNIDGPLADKMRAKNVPCHQLTMNSPFDRKAAKDLVKICKENGIDVIHAQYPRENYIALAAKKKLPTLKVIFTSHLTLCQNAVWKFFNKRLMKNNDCVISVCNEGRDILIANGVPKDRIKVIFNGIDASKSPEHDRSYIADLVPENAVVATALARLSPEKGLDFLIDCVAEAKKKAKGDLRVLIAGDGELKDQLQEHIDRCGLPETVKLLGFRTDVPKILAASDIGLNCASSNEAMSFALLESLAAGLALVTTDVGGNRDLCEYAGEAGICVPYGNTAAYAEALVTLTDNAEKRTQMSANARHKAQNEFDLSSLLSQTIKLYK